MTSVRSGRSARSLVGLVALAVLAGIFAGPVAAKDRDLGVQGLFATPRAGTVAWKKIGLKMPFNWSDPANFGTITKRVLTVESAYPSRDCAGGSWQTVGDPEIVSVKEGERYAAPRTHTVTLREPLTCYRIRLDYTNDQNDQVHAVSGAYLTEGDKANTTPTGGLEIRWRTPSPQSSKILTSNAVSLAYEITTAGPMFTGDREPKLSSIKLTTYVADAPGSDATIYCYGVSSDRYLPEGKAVSVKATGTANVTVPADGKCRYWRLVARDSHNRVAVASSGAVRLERGKVAQVAPEIPGIPLPTGGKASGELGGPVYDVVYAVQLAAGATLDATLTTSGGAEGGLYLFAPSAKTVRVQSGDASIIAVGRTSGRTSKLTFTAPAAGRYYLDLNGKTEVLGRYSLSAKIGAPKATKAPATPRPTKAPKATKAPATPRPTKVATPKPTRAPATPKPTTAPTGFALNAPPVTGTLSAEGGMLTFDNALGLHRLSIKAYTRVRVTVKADGPIYVEERTGLTTGDDAGAVRERSADGRSFTFSADYTKAGKLVFAVWPGVPYTDESGNKVEQWQSPITYTIEATGGALPKPTRAPQATKAPRASGKWSGLGAPTLAWVYPKIGAWVTDLYPGPNTISWTGNATKLYILHNYWAKKLADGSCPDFSTKTYSGKKVAGRGWVWTVDAKTKDFRIKSSLGDYCDVVAVTGVNLDRTRSAPLYSGIMRVVARP